MQHLALIMDGNRRWAAQNGLAAVFHGHRKGAEALERVLKFCLERGIKYLSLYTFSLENLQRSEEEKRYMFDLLVEMLAKKRHYFVEHGIRISFVGDRTRFPSRVLSAVQDAEEATEHLSTLQVMFLFCYGAQQELVYAAKRLAEQVVAGDLKVEDISEQTLRNACWMPSCPDPDLVIRTGGQTRLSNFLLYQVAYSELMFLDCYWPEITEEHLAQCEEKFVATQQNFGK